MKMTLSLLLLSLISLNSWAQNKDGFSLEMFGGSFSVQNAFGSKYDYQGIKAWTGIAFEAGAGAAFRQNAGRNQQWGLKLGISRMAFSYTGSDYVDGNGNTQIYRPQSTRRIYFNFSPIYAIRLAESSSFDFDLESSLCIKLPINAYSLSLDAAQNNTDINDFDRYSLGELSVFQARIAPTFVWETTRLGVYFAYNVNSGSNWESISGWGAGLQISYFVED